MKPFNWRQHLRNDAGEAVVFPQEGDELLAGSVHGEAPGLHLLAPQHRLEQPLAAARPLPRLRHVEVEDAHGAELVRLAGTVQQKQLLPPHLQHTHNLRRGGSLQLYQ